MSVLHAKYPLLAEAIRSVGHVCDHVMFAYRSDAPGEMYYHVRCDLNLHYTVGVSTTRVVVWPGDVSP